MGEHEALLPDGLPGAGLLTDDLRYTTYAGLYVSLAKHLHFTEVVLFQDSAGPTPPTCASTPTPGSSAR